ncbi:MAG TPA: PDGLE domain-containing protein [Methanoregulaceae archaeon]|nr:PDGLE domain-containing protein [Methanoregulaceae archaeon]
MKLMEFDKNLKIYLLIIGVLIILAPLGLLAQGTAYGEWSTDDIQQMLGYIPAGLDQLSSLWNAPLPDYGLPGQSEAFSGLAAGYYISAVVGVVLCIVVMYLLGMALAKRNEESKNP